ncbi:MAG: hypothetical protein QUU85_10875 [Candidatus Eisenbacteria bacterium]|nr:hypothetical protein [Candidatus Eisenbacteria bacterium]
MLRLAHDVGARSHGEVAMGRADLLLTRDDSQAFCIPRLSLIHI